MKIVDFKAIAETIVVGKLALGGKMAAGAAAVSLRGFDYALHPVAVASGNRFTQLQVQVAGGSKEPPVTVAQALARVGLTQCAIVGAAAAAGRRGCG